MRGWLIGAALLTVLFTTIGCGVRGGPPEHPDDGGDSGAAPPAALSIIGRGNEITLTGDLPDPAAKRALLDAVITAADGVSVIDRLGIMPGIKTLDFAASAPVFETAAVLGDFTVTLTADTVTLAGTAAKAAEATAVATAARDAWPQARIVNEIATRS